MASDNLVDSGIIKAYIAGLIDDYSLVGMVSQGGLAPYVATPPASFPIYTLGLTADKKVKLRCVSVDSFTVDYEQTLYADGFPGCAFAITDFSATVDVYVETTVDGNIHYTTELPWTWTPPFNGVLTWNSTTKVKYKRASDGLTNILNEDHSPAGLDEGRGPLNIWSIGLPMGAGTGSESGEDDNGIIAYDHHTPISVGFSNVLPEATDLAEIYIAHNIDQLCIQTILG
jgi:hypothetical protein